MDLRANMTTTAVSRSGRGTLAVAPVAPTTNENAAGSFTLIAMRIRNALFYLLIPLLSVDARAEDLWDVYQLAKNNDPTFQAATYTFEAEQQRVPGARAALLPSASLGASRGWNKDRIEAPGQPFIVQGRGEYYANRYDFSVVQPLYDRGKYLGYKQAQSELEVARYQYEIARQDLGLRVAIRYFAVLAAHDNLDLTVAERTANARQLELADERLQVGLGTTTDLYDAQARFRLAESQEIAAQNALEDARRALAEVVGNLVGPLARLRPDSPLNPPNPDNVDHWVAEALTGNLELAVSRQFETVAQKEIERQKSGHYPSVDLVVSYAKDDADGSISGPGRESTSTDAVVELNVPLVQGGAVVYATREARLRYDAAQSQTESARRAAERNARSAYLAIITSIRQVRALDQAVVASESALEAKREGFEAGLETNIDVLNAQRDLFRAKRDYLQARYDYILNWLRLKQAVGSLTDQDFQAATGWLE